MSHYTAIQTAKENSARAFREHVWPLWREHLEGIEIHSVEDRPDRLSKLLDSFGIDGFYIKTATGAPIPIASRVEFKDKEPRFTLRYSFVDSRTGLVSDDCEFRRKVTALADPDSRRYLPFYTIQSAVVDGAVLHSLLVRTERLRIRPRQRGRHHQARLGHPVHAYPNGRSRPCRRAGPYQAVMLRVMAASRS